MVYTVCKGLSVPILRVIAVLKDCNATKAVKSLDGYQVYVFCAYQMILLVVLAIKWSNSLILQKLSEYTRTNKVTCVGLTFCCFMVYSTRRFVSSLTVCYFVLVFFSPFSIVPTSFGEERANLSTFRTFVRFALVWFCLFPLSLGVWEGCSLSLWQSLDFPLTFF